MRRAIVLTLLLVPLLAGCASQAPAPQVKAGREDVQPFTLPAGSSIEWKLYLAQGQGMNYSWSASRPVYFDFHGDFDDGTESFVSHKTSTLATDQGSFTAPFTGRHGWYWENRNAQAVTITLTTSGSYAIVGRTGGDAP